ncbi:translation initiation factor IF-3 [Caldisericum exile]|uniref:translation initiation factor IF-3 n=1 Tax=Caldisericum exile TaxID=693075 RepID=UPI0012E9AE58
MNSKDVIANENIRLKEVRLIDENGAQVGIMSSRDALNIAREKGLDLVLIAPNANPPVCRIVDLGKYLYEQTKKEKEAKKKQTKIEVKQMRYRLKIDTNDLAIKNKKVREFIEDGNRVNIEIWFRGREMAFTDQGFELANKIIDALSDVAIVASPPKMAGKNLVFSLEPNKEVLKKLRERREAHEKQNQVKQISNEEV